MYDLYRKVPNVIYYNPYFCRNVKLTRFFFFMLTINKVLNILNVFFKSKSIAHFLINIQIYIITLDKYNNITKIIYCEIN